MILSDKVQFKMLMDSVSEYYQREKLSKIALQLYFTALERFEFQQIQESISQHIQQPASGQYYPKVADIITILEGGKLTTDQVIAEARMRRTPFGVLCAIKIGSWDLNNQHDMFYLKQRAEECLQMLPEWKSRAASGEYTDHEISIMLKYEVEPWSPFRDGLPPPAGALQLKKRSKLISNTARHKYLLEPPYDGGNDKNLTPAPEVARLIDKTLK